MWSDWTPSYIIAISSLNRSTLLLPHRPPTQFTKGLPLPKLLHQLNQNQPPHQHRHRRLASAFDTSRKETSPSSDSESDSLSSDRPPVDIFLEEGELSEDQEANLSDHNQSLSEEQSYQETGLTFRTLTPALPPLRITPSPAPRCTLQEKFL